MKSFARNAELCEVVCARLRYEGGARVAAAKICDLLVKHDLQSPTMLCLSDPPAIIEFGHFSTFPHRRQLLADGRPITLGGRAFDVLLALIEAPGRLSAQRSCKAEYGRAGSSTRRARGRDFSARAGSSEAKAPGTNAVLTISGYWMTRQLSRDPWRGAGFWSAPIRNCSRSDHAGFVYCDHADRKSHNTVYFATMPR